MLARESTPRRIPASYAVVAVLGAVYVVEVLAGRQLGDPNALDPSVDLTVALGALAEPLVADGDWYRLFACVLLHSSLIHFAGNAIGILWLGGIVERGAGSSLMLSTLVLGGIGGAFAAWLIGPAQSAGVGASGAVLGLVGLAIALGPAGPSRWAPLVLLVVIQIAGGIAVAAAHIGGAVAGALPAVVWVAFEGSRSKLRAAARGLAPIGIGVYALAAVIAIASFREHAPRTAALIATRELRIPDERLRDRAAAMADADRLVVEYPRDPRGWVILGARRTMQDDPEGAEQAYRRALERRMIPLPYTHRDLAPVTRLALAESLLAQERDDEASEVVRSACGHHRVRARAIELGLCDPEHRETP